MFLFCSFVPFCSSFLRISVDGGYKLEIIFDTCQLPPGWEQDTIRKGDFSPLLSKIVALTYCGNNAVAIVLFVFFTVQF